jgi:cell division protein FtsN
MSVHMGDVSLDYAFTPRQYFADTHTFSIRFAFGGYHRAADMPVHDTAPIFSSSPAAPGADPTPAVPVDATGREQSYVIVAGNHSRLESAEAEVRSLLLLKVPAVVEQNGDHYWVVVERFDSRDAAVAQLRNLRNLGHQFSIIVHGQ